MRFEGVLRVSRWFSLYLECHGRIGGDAEGSHVSWEFCILFIFLMFWYDFIHSKIYSYSLILLLFVCIRVSHKHRKMFVELVLTLHYSTIDINYYRKNWETNNAVIRVYIFKLKYNVFITYFIIRIVW